MVRPIEHKPEPNTTPQPYTLSATEQESVRELLTQMQPIQAGLTALLNHFVRANGLVRENGQGWGLSQDGKTLIPQ